MESGQEQKAGTVATGGRPSGGHEAGKHRQPETPGTENRIRPGGGRRGAARLLFSEMEDNQMRVILAEKPSVAQAIASVVGAHQRKEGYLMGGGYAVAWAFGHLVGLAMPESYGLSGFRREHLPILPQEFRLVPRQVREGKAYKDDPGVVRQLGVIRDLFDRCPHAYHNFR